MAPDMWDGWAKAPGATNQDQEDALVAISICRSILEIFGGDISMIPRWDTLSSRQIELLSKLKG